VGRLAGVAPGDQGQQVTLGLGLQNPPSWVFSLADVHLWDGTIPFTTYVTMISQ
jgi:hypothetical protein